MDEVMSGQVIVQFINYLLEYDNLSIVYENNIDSTFFPGYEIEFNFIIEHYNKTKLLDGKARVPDKIEFAYQFPDFPLFAPQDTPQTLYRSLLEQKCYSLYVQTLQEGAEKSKESSFEAIEFTKQKLDELNKFANNTIGAGKDLIKQAGERLDDYIKRIEVHGLIGIKTGDEAMDKNLHGWLPEDFIVIIARTNEGKSWLLQRYLIQACMQGKKVGLYSGEMGHLLLGYRFDTLYQHFGNMQLIGGDPNLGSSEVPEVGIKTMNEYRKYIDALLKGDLPEFRVFTQKDLGGKMSVNKLKTLQDKHDFAIWGIDQISLMQDDKKAHEERIRYGNISEGLFSCTEEWQRPIISVHQALRKAAEAKKKDPNATPELEDAFGADAIMQNATRGISFTQILNGAKATVIKNRYGLKGQEFLYIWNINYGVFQPMTTSDIKDNLF